MDWDSLFKYLTGIAGVSVAIAFVGKKAVEAFLSSRIEKYKSNLERITTEHSIRFQQLHTERAQVIKEMYQKLVDLDLALDATLKAFHHISEPSLEEKITAVSKAHNDLYYFYLPKKIFFEKSLCSLLDGIVDSSKSVFIDITTFPVDPTSIEYKYDRGLLMERHEYWEKARKIHEIEIKELKEKLEDEFRNILGIKA